jgi:hypothetical protein
MKVMIIHPHQGVDQIQFEMSRADVERAVGAAPRRMRHRHAVSDNDSFPSMGLNVMYDEHDRRNAIGIASGVDTDADYNGY